MIVHVRSVNIVLAALASAALGCARPSVAVPVPLPTPPTVVVVVRHAEKAGPSGDVDLSASGETRATLLAANLSNARVDGVITTALKRTRATAAPLVRARNLIPIEVAPKPDVSAHAREIADIVRTRFAGRTVVVVGHSNTVPAIIGALGGPRLPDLCDSEYANLFVVVLAAGDSARLIRSQYGAPDPDVATGCPTMR